MSLPAWPLQPPADSGLAAEGEWRYGRHFLHRLVFPRHLVRAGITAWLFPAASPSLCSLWAPAPGHCRRVALLQSPSASVERFQLPCATHVCRCLVPWQLTSTRSTTCCSPVTPSTPCSCTSRPSRRPTGSSTVETAKSKSSVPLCPWHGHHYIHRVMLDTELKRPGY